MILNYLRRHPDAGDTLEGITRWWLECKSIDNNVDEIAEVLEVLTKQGILVVYKESNGTVFYRPDRSKNISSVDGKSEKLC
jgi:hypothetical protein